MDLCIISTVEFCKTTRLLSILNQLNELDVGTYISVCNF